MAEWCRYYEASSGACTHPVWLGRVTGSYISGADFIDKHCPKDKIPNTCKIDGAKCKAGIDLRELMKLRRGGPVLG